jgi:hypothetical protein
LNAHAEDFDHHFDQKNSAENNIDHVIAPNFFFVDVKSIERQHYAVDDDQSHDDHDEHGVGAD